MIAILFHEYSNPLPENRWVRCAAGVNVCREIIVRVVIAGKRQMNLGGIQQKRTIGLMIETLHHQGNVDAAGKRAVFKI